ncbi:hypothetical protein DM02DRAFT_305230 [Periconia macrospinosa]|uniref:Uncharacterized protein n=1 Tax=Periconia macrospinosa TaxID=97972 RepID=A0A2V1D1V7_9PLEO|nr:hypothetical protein DM02DRAFT_305230 [Periconia macrospinosa]
MWRGLNSRPPPPWHLGSGHPSDHSVRVCIPFFRFRGPTANRAALLLVVLVLTLVDILRPKRRRVPFNRPAPNNNNHVPPPKQSQKLLRFYPSSYTAFLVFPRYVRQQTPIYTPYMTHFTCTNILILIWVKGFIVSSLKPEQPCSNLFFSVLYAVCNQKFHPIPPAVPSSLVISRHPNRNIHPVITKSSCTTP